MNESEPVVHVVDDDISHLTAVARLLRAVGYAVQTYDLAQAYLAKRDDTPGCVLADVNMPVLDGLQLQRQLAQAEDGPPIVFLTGQGDIETSVRAMRHGAEDFLTKHAPKAALIDAIERAFVRDALQRKQRSHRRLVHRRLGLLTPREREVLEQVVRGRLNKQIGADLGISERTVKLHRTAITTKLEIRSTAELALLVHQAER